MKAVVEIFSELQARGVRIEPRPRGVAFVPADRVDANLRARILAHRREVLVAARDALAKVAPVLTPLPPASTIESWTEDEAYDLLGRVLSRINHNYERAGLPLRSRLRSLFEVFEPVLTQLFEEGDYPSLRYALVDFEKQCDDTINGWKA